MICSAVEWITLKMIRVSASSLRSGSEHLTSMGSSNAPVTTIVFAVGAFSMRAVPSRSCKPILFSLINYHHVVGCLWEIWPWVPLCACVCFFPFFLPLALPFLVSSLTEASHSGPYLHVDPLAIYPYPTPSHIPQTFGYFLWAPCKHEPCPILHDEFVWDLIEVWFEMFPHFHTNPFTTRRWFSLNVKEIGKSQLFHQDGALEPF